jgi:hypothetical protein
MSAIKIIRGDTATINASFQDSDGVAIDLTGGKVFLTVNTSDTPTDDTSAVIEKDIDSFTTPTTGEVTITLTSTDTNITPANYWYDIQFVSSTGVVTSLDKQRFIVKSDISRRIA